MSEVEFARRRRSRAEIQTLVAEFEASGLKRGAFCRQRGLAIGTLDKYRRRVQSKPYSGAGSLLPVEVAPSMALDVHGVAGRDGTLVVELRSGRRIEVHRGFDAESLKRLLSVLDGA
jgi:hypothetical protein